MAIPRPDDERDQLWNPALPGSPASSASMLQALAPTAAPAAPPPPRAAPGIPALAQEMPTPALQAFPPTPGAPPVAAQPQPRTYKPDIADYLYGLLAGFGGNFGTSAREQRWNSGQDRARQQERDKVDAERLRIWAESQGVNAGNAAKRQELADKNLQLRERTVATGEAKEKRLADAQDAMRNPESAPAEALRDALEMRGTPREHTAQLNDQQMRAMLTQFNRDDERRTAEEDTRIAARRAGATSGAATAARESVQLPYDIAAEERGEGRAERASERSVETESQQKIEDAERKRATERVALETLKAKLSGRPANDRLPAQGSFIERGAIKARASVMGGTGMGQEDSILDNDLTALGLQSYINKAGNAPNSEREQDVAGRMYRGDGTVAGAIRAIEERLGTMDAEVGQMRRTAPRRPAARAAAPAPAPAASGGDDEWEDL